MNSNGLTFGIYPLRAAGTPFGVALGPEDDYEKIALAIRDLEGPSRRLYSRNYLIYTEAWESKMLENADRYLAAGILEDLVIGCGDWTDSGDQEMALESWLGFIRRVVGRYGRRLTSLQITNEPNLSFMEGAKPYALRALTEGVAVAKDEARRLGLEMPVGFGSVPEGPASVAGFWEALARAGSGFLESVDFVGHNFYVDVFEDRPLELTEIASSAERILRELREKSLTAAGIPGSVPIRVAENGWPTGKNPVAGTLRTPARQQEVLETVIRKVHSLGAELNVSHYALFGLRDADSGQEDLFHQFGILRDDYAPKPAYNAFKALIRALGRDSGDKR